MAMLPSHSDLPGNFILFNFLVLVCLRNTRPSSCLYLPFSRPLCLMSRTESIVNYGFIILEKSRSTIPSQGICTWVFTKCIWCVTELFVSSIMTYELPFISIHDPFTLFTLTFPSGSYFVEAVNFASLMCAQVSTSNNNWLSVLRSLLAWGIRVLYSCTAYCVNWTVVRQSFP